MIGAKTDPSQKANTKKTENKKINYNSHQAFYVSKIKISGTKTSKGPWKLSTEFSDKDSVKILVAASWCPHCHDYMEKIANGSREADFVVFYEDELEKFLERKVRYKKITAAQKEELLKEHEVNGQYLAYPSQSQNTGLIIISSGPVSLTHLSQAILP